MLYFNHSQDNEVYQFETMEEAEKSYVGKFLVRLPDKPSVWHFWNGGEWEAVPEDQRFDEEGNLVTG